MVATFFKFEFKSNTLCIGERTKKGTFRPCLDIIPCSTVIGMLYNYIGGVEPTVKEKFPILAVGGKINCKRENMIYAPYDLAVGTAKIPLLIEYMKDAEGEFYVKKTKKIPKLETIKLKLEKHGGFRMGAFKSKGFGHCEITGFDEFEAPIIEREGTLNTRIYADRNFLKLFGIQEIIKPRYGYLFYKTSMEEGYYQKSIFEGSRILGGFDFIMEEYNGRDKKISG